MKRDFKGIWIPKGLWERSDLSTSEKILLMEIDSLDCGYGCWAGNEHFASLLRKQTGTIANMLSDLRNRGIISVTVANSGAKRSIIAVHEKMNPEGLGSRKNESGVHEKMKAYKESSTNSSNTTDMALPKTEPPNPEPKPINWENCYNDFQRLMAFYVKNWYEDLYKSGTREQVNAFYRTYGVLFRDFLALAGSLEIACNAIVYFDRHFKKEGWSWNLKTLKTNFPEFVNYAIQKQKEGTV